MKLFATSDARDFILPPQIANLFDCKCLAMCMCAFCVVESKNYQANKERRIIILTIPFFIRSDKANMLDNMLIQFVWKVSDTLVFTSSFDWFAWIEMNIRWKKFTFGVFFSSLILHQKQIQLLNAELNVRRQRIKGTNSPACVNDAARSEYETTFIANRV